jgi:hypothetical protein
MQTAALCTFALSVGFRDAQNRAAQIPGTNTLLPIFSGTAVAIDPHHLLTAAHMFELDLSRFNVNPVDLHYQYTSCRSC